MSEIKTNAFLRSDDRAAYQPLSYIKNSTLTGSYGTHGLFGSHQQAAIVHALHTARHRAAMVADAHCQFRTVIEFGLAHRQKIFCKESLCLQILFRAENDGVLSGIEAYHISRPAQCNTESFALPNGVERNSPVRTQPPAGAVDVAATGHFVFQSGTLGV